MDAYAAACLLPPLRLRSNEQLPGVGAENTIILAVENAVQTIKNLVFLTIMANPIASLHTSTRIRIATTLLILFAITTNVHLLYKTLSHGLDIGMADPISRFEKRFEKIKPLLPSHGVVGYLGDERDDEHESGRSFYLTQYALAPTIVLRTTNADFVVVNLRDDAESAVPAAMDGWVLLRDCFNGVRLYRRKAP